MSFRIDPVRAAALKRQMTWDQVGKQLAWEQGRPIPYGGNAVIRAIKASKKDKA